MPIYEYQCSTCEHEFEQIQKFSDPAVTDCPQCSAQGSVSKKLSASAFILNGRGWYSDGYGGKNGKSAKAGAKEGGDAKSDSGSGGKGVSSSGGETSPHGCGGGGCGHCAA